MPPRPRLLAAAAAAALLGTALAPAAASAAPGAKGRAAATTGTATVTVLGTTDLHGNVLNWDYYKNAEYSDSARNAIGLARVSTLVQQERAAAAPGSTLLVDAGDTIQGTPLAYYYAKVDPITGGSVHPMAAAMNAVRYDAAALGNHEFNYGLDTLRAFESQLDFPLLGANVLDEQTGEPAFQPYVMKTVKLKGEKPIKVGILGLTNPGVAIWDKAIVEGRLRFPGIVEQAREFVPEMRAAGADVVVVSAHSGVDTSSSYGDALPYPENASTLLAEQVPGIDAILVGHAHQEVVQKHVRNTATGKQVLLTEPLRWGMRLSVMDFQLERVRGKWRVESSTARLRNAAQVAPDPAVLTAVDAQHRTVVDYVNTPVGTSTERMSMAESRYRDTPILDLINEVQTDTVEAALAGTADAELPVLSIAAPFNREAAIPAGPVTVRDVAGAYIFDNTLLGVRMTGAQVREYLEFSARYFSQVAPGVAVTPDAVTNARTTVAPTGTPDYNADFLSGVDYDIDLSRPVGSRIVSLTRDGVPVTDTQQFVVAVNNYRQSGGGGFPAVSTAPVVYNAQAEIRQLIVDWVTARGALDPATFAVQNWRLVREGQPVFP